MNERKAGRDGPSRKGPGPRPGREPEKEEGSFKGILNPLREAGPVHISILLVILFAGIFLRFSSLSDSTIGTDEAEKVLAVEEFREGRFWVDLEHPPLEKYLILLSTSLLGNSDQTIKLPNVIIGSLIPFALFLVGMRLGKDPWIGQAAAAIGALSPMLIGYSLVAKEDTLVNFLSLFSLLFLSVSLEAERDVERRRDARIRSNLDLVSIKRAIDPGNLDGYAMTAAFLSGLALASKYTFVIYAIAVLPVIILTNKSWIRRKGPAFLFIMLVTFLILSWYYLNPYWLALGIGHWIWESATGHSTYFLGRTYTYPPIWFYKIVFIGRVAPLISLGGGIAVIWGFLELPWRNKTKVVKAEGWKERKGLFVERIVSHMREDPLKWMLFSWVVIGFIIMSILPFKGIRYVQWILLPIICLVAYYLNRFLHFLKVDIRGTAATLICIGLMIPALSLASPYYREVTYFLGDDSGMKDLDGQGFSETFDWMDDHHLSGTVSVRWEKLASYYWDDVTGPITNMSEANENNVDYILLYRADTNRDIEPDFTDLAREQLEIFVYKHGGYELVWLYEMNYPE